MTRPFVPALAAGLLLLSSVSSVHAQASGGNIVGDARAGDTVVITGDGLGFKRELKIKEDGRYQVRRVPTGSYTVVKLRADGTIGPAQAIVVRVGSTARVMDRPQEQ